VKQLSGVEGNRTIGLAATDVKCYRERRVRKDILSGIPKSDRELGRNGSTGPKDRQEA